MTVDQYADFGALLSSCNDVESAEVPALLDEIFTAISTAGMTKAFEMLDPAAGADWLEENCTVAASLFKAFIKRHGHRAYMEVSIKKAIYFFILVVKHFYAV